MGDEKLARDEFWFSSGSGKSHSVKNHKSGVKWNQREQKFRTKEDYEKA